MKRLKHEFASKRRRMLRGGSMEEYKKTVLLYNSTVESKIEDNLRFVCKKVRSQHLTIQARFIY
jgi:hypothetical protein